MQGYGNFHIRKCLARLHKNTEHQPGNSTGGKGDVSIFYGWRIFLYLFSGSVGQKYVLGAVRYGIIFLKADPPERPGHGRFKKDPNSYHGLFKQVC